MNSLPAEISFKKIILISLDTLRADCIPSNPINLYKGEYRVNTVLNQSFLDKLLLQGVFFNYVISAAPYTSASHAAIFTGLWPIENGLYDQFNQKLHAKTVFSFAQELGYTTIFKTDFPLILGKHLGMLDGVDHYFIEDNDAALQRLEREESALAFFHFGAIHYPYGFHNLELGGQEYIDKIHSLEELYSIKPGVHENLDDMAVETFRSPDDLRLLFRYKTIIQKLFREKRYDELFDLYLEGINHFMSTQFNPFISKLLTLLEKSGPYLIVIFSDHGEGWSDDCYGHHNSLDEGVIRVPLLFYTPGIHHKIVSNRARTIDITPTILSLIKYSGDTRFSGESLENSIFGNEAIEDRDAFSQVWITDIKDVVAASHAILQGKEMHHDAQNIHYKEAIYHAYWKYHKQYYHFVNNSEKLEPYSNASLINLQNIQQPEVASENIPSDLPKIFDELLLAYNLRKEHGPIESNVSENIRRYLNSMGYKV